MTREQRDRSKAIMVILLIPARRSFTMRVFQHSAWSNRPCSCKTDGGRERKNSWPINERNTNLNCVITVFGYNRTWVDNNPIQTAHDDLDKKITNGTNSESNLHVLLPVAAYIDKSLRRKVVSATWYNHVWVWSCMLCTKGQSILFYSTGVTRPVAEICDLM